MENKKKQAFIEQVHNALTYKGYVLPEDTTPTGDDYDLGYSVDESVQNWIEHGELKKK